MKKEYAIECAPTIIKHESEGFYSYEFHDKKNIMNDYYKESGISNSGFQVKTKSCYGLVFKGFNELLYFDETKSNAEFIPFFSNPEIFTEEDLNVVVKLLQNTSIHIPDLNCFGLLFGRVGIKTTASDELGVIWSPYQVYKVHTNERGGFLPIDTYKKYIQSEWLKEYSHAILNKERKEAKLIESLALPVLFFLGTAVLVFALVFLWTKSPNSSQKALESRLNSEPSLVDVYKEDGVDKPSDEGVILKGTPDTPEQQNHDVVDFGNMDAEQLKKMQEYQVEATLKKMGIDPNKAVKPLDCFSETSDK